MNIAESILATIGHTPLVKLSRINTGHAELLAKVEARNPGGSVKDRVAYAMIETAERDGRLQPGGVIIEPTSGNTGIGLSMVAAVKDYRLIIVMPDTMSIERRKLMAAYGAELVLTDGKLGMKGAIAKAQELAKEIPGAFIPSQFDNPANPEIHAQTTAQEILSDTDGKIDVLVAGVGTGGTLSGIGKAIRAVLPDLEIVAVEPDASAILSGRPAGPHPIQGIGAGFVPGNLDTSLISKILTVKGDDALLTMHRLAELEGILAGISSGAALSAALELSEMPAYAGKRIVVILPDTGERYLSII